MHRNIQQLRWAIIIGTTLPFLIYAIWQWMIIGSIPVAEIAQAASEGIPITQVLRNHHRSSVGKLFGFILWLFRTSYIIFGVSLSMVDFLADGLSVSRRGWKRIALCLAVLPSGPIRCKPSRNIFGSPWYRRGLWRSYLKRPFSYRHGLDRTL